MTKREYYAKKQKEIDLKNKQREEDDKLFTEELEAKCFFISMANAYNIDSKENYLSFLIEQCKEFNIDQIKLIYKKIEIEELKEVIKFRQLQDKIKDF